MPTFPNANSCHGHQLSIFVGAVKGIAVFAFFFIFTVLIAAGLAMGVHGKSGGWALLSLSTLAYTGLFVKSGCLGSH